MMPEFGKYSDFIDTTCLRATVVVSNLGPYLLTVLTSETQYNLRKLAQFLLTDVLLVIKVCLPSKDFSVICSTSNTTQIKVNYC